VWNKSHKPAATGKGPKRSPAPGPAGQTWQQKSAQETKGERREARAARPRALVRPETWGGGGLAASPPAHRLNAAASATPPSSGSAASSCYSGPWRLGVGTMRVFHESVTIVRVGSVGCWLVNHHRVPFSKNHLRVMCGWA